MLIFWVNIYPPIYEIKGTYKTFNRIVQNEKIIEVHKYFIIQNPSRNEDDILKTVKTYLDKTEEAQVLLKDQLIKDTAASKIKIEIHFYKKGGIEGIHRFWRADRYDDIQAEQFSKYRLMSYYLTYERGKCTEQFGVFDPNTGWDCIEENIYSFDE